MHLPLPILQFLALLLSSTTLAESPTKEQVDAGRIEGRCSAPPKLKQDWAVISFCHCKRGDGAENRNRYRQLEYYNLHLNATFILEASRFDIQTNSWSGTGDISICREFPRGPDDPNKDKLCFTDHNEFFPCYDLVQQRESGTDYFGDHPRIHWNRQKRGFGACSSRDQGFKLLERYETEVRCRVYCRTFLDMEMIEGAPQSDAQAVAELQYVDVMCDGCK